MAKKTISTRPGSPLATPKAAAAKPVSTAVRNTAIPKAQPVMKPREITAAMIAQRAYEIWQSGQGGSELDNWLRAERELRGA